MYFREKLLQMCSKGRPHFKGDIEARDQIADDCIFSRLLRLFFTPIFHSGILNENNKYDEICTETQRESGKN